MDLYFPLQPIDLQLFLNLPAIDNDRADLLLTAAQNLCESIVSPLPDSAAVVALTVAARAYTNPAQMATAGLGTANLTYGQIPGAGPIGGLYLSRADKATLRRLSGGSSAFGVSTLPTGASAVQSLTIAATAGTFTLGLGGYVTAPLAASATAADIAAALTAVAGIGANNVSVTGANPYTVTFINSLGATDVPTLTPDVTNLTGTVSVTVVTRGIRAPGTDLAPWNRDYYSGNGGLSQIYGGQP